MGKQLRALSLIVALSASFSGLANNVGAVYGPVINPQDSSMQFRFATSPSKENASEASAARLHYQKALNDSFRWRLITQVRDVTGSYQYDSAGVEFLWQFQHKKEGFWDSALRFDFRTRRGERPESIGLNWTNQWSISDRLTATALASFSWNVDGQQRATGTFFETRTRIAYKTDAGVTLGLDSFNGWGKVGDFGSFNQQSHQIGPTVSGKISDYSYLIGYLAGVSNGARDDVFRFWIGTSF